VGDDANYGEKKSPFSKQLLLLKRNQEGGAPPANLSLTGPDLGIIQCVVHKLKGGKHWAGWQAEIY
jgi:hypothetical protein